MGDAGVVGPELRIARQRLVAECPAEARVLLGVHDDDLDPAVLGPERLGGREVRVPVAHAGRPLARVEVVGDWIGEQRQGRGEQAHVEVLAPPGAQAMRERGVGDAEGEERRGQVGHGAAHLRRRMARHSRERHDAAHALGDRVVARPPRVRPVLTEARHRDVDRRRVHGAHRRVAEPELVGDPGQEVLDDDVGATGQLEHERAALGLTQIHGDAALSAIDRGERRAHPAAAPRAQIVAAPGTLHLHHVGAEIGHQRGAIRARDHAGEVEHADALEHHRAVSHDRGTPPSSR